MAGQDPCAGANPAASAAVCALTGVSADQYGHVIECPADTCSALGGGNQALKPETANTWTLGFVLTPQAIKNFSLSADYYNIKVTDYISSVDATLVISQCVATGDPYFCGLFNRDPRTGAIFGSQGYIVSTTLNTGYLKTAGVDITADYSFDVGSLGTINTNIVGTWLSKQESAPLPGLGSYDCKGLYGYTCGQPSPEWRHVARATWMFPTDTSVSVSWRHLGGTKLSSLSDNPFLTGTLSVINAKIDSYDYIDLAVTQTLGEHVQLRAGVNNLFDLDPPAIAFGILSSFGNGNTYPGVYDPLGRTIFVNATVEF